MIIKVYIVINITLIIITIIYNFFTFIFTIFLLYIFRVILLYCFCCIIVIAIVMLLENENYCKVIDIILDNSQSLVLLRMIFR